MSVHVVVIDDEENMRWVIKEALESAGYEVSTAAGGQEALTLLGAQIADLVVLDLKMRGMDGLTTLRHIQARWPDTVVLMLTAYGSVSTAVEAMSLGAADYLRKPFDIEELRFKIGRALERRALHQEVRQLRDTRPEQPSILRGSHPAWMRARDQVRCLNRLGLDILILGEQGTGKRSLAHLAHQESDRAHRPLVELDVRTVAAAAQGPLLAGTTTIDGLWSRSGAGTLLLHHVDALSPDGWQQLAALLAQRTQQMPRLLCTATEILPDAAALLPGQIVLPPLRERISDIPELIADLLPPGRLAPEVLGLLESWDWPGNVAELRAIATRTAALAGPDPVRPDHLPSQLQTAERAEAFVHLPPEGIVLEEVEKQLLREALALAQGNKTRASELLGLTRHQLLYRLEKYGIDPTKE